jgi:hypothetical protein
VLKRFKKKHGKYIEEPRVKTEIVVVGEVVHEPPEEDAPGAVAGVGGGAGCAGCVFANILRGIDGVRCCGGRR